MPSSISFSFPINTPASGVPLGNGLLGVLAWGQEKLLRLTLSRADFWDHRGGVQLTGQHNYHNIRDLLEHGNEDKLRQLFASEQKGSEDQELDPTLIPVGRIEIEFPHSIHAAELDLNNGQIHFFGYQDNHMASLTLSMEAPVAELRFETGIQPTSVSAVPASETLKKAFEKRGIPPARGFYSGINMGFVQPLPEDNSLGLFITQHEERSTFSLVRAETEAEARDHARILANYASLEDLPSTSADWWNHFWMRVPQLELPDPKLQRLHDYGIYLLAAATHNNGGVITGPHGPWLSDEHMPPEGGTYDFGGKLQFNYAACLTANLTDNLQSLWNQIGKWTSTLEKDALHFTGLPQSMLLPRKCDDRGRSIANDWNGTIDPANATEIAFLMYQYFDYTQDTHFLEERALPFMKAALNTWKPLIEEGPNGLELPISFSPSYKGNHVDAWGGNSSHALASIHGLLDKLLQAAAALEIEPDPFWRQLQQNLPKASTALGTEGHLAFEPGCRRIQIWQGQDLEESHHRHSHLAGLYPFDTLDIQDDEWRDIIAHTLNEWVARGMGLWESFSFASASILQSRCGLGEMARLSLELMRKSFSSRTGNLVHRTAFYGLSLRGSRPVWQAPGEAKRKSESHFQAGDCMAASHAVQQMLLHQARGIHYFFRGIPDEWADVSFQGMRTPGAFLISASRQRKEVTSIQIESLSGGHFTLANPWRKLEIGISDPSCLIDISKEQITIYIPGGESVELNPDDLGRAQNNGEEDSLSFF